MPDLLIRNIDEDTKKFLAIRAAEHGCSQQAEALAILKEALQPQQKSWVSLIRDNALAVDGMEFELSPRHAPRFTGIEFSS